MTKADPINLAVPAGASVARMRLTVLGGFLGSGKTTWLRHQLHHGLLADAFVVVNEVAETAVDNALLSQSAELAILAGGCACCDALGDLVALLRRICDARTGGKVAPRLDQIVLETSGMADPGPIVAAIRADPILVHHIVIGEIIVAVDAVYGKRQLREEPLCRRQLELADRLIVTKIDEAKPRSSRVSSPRCFGSIRGRRYPVPSRAASLHFRIMTASPRRHFPSSTIKLPVRRL